MGYRPVRPLLPGEMEIFRPWRWDKRKNRVVYAAEYGLKAFRLVIKDPSPAK